MDPVLPSIITTRATASILTLTFALSIVYILSSVVYRLYFHPLSSFPGPTLAGATDLWKAYVQCTKSFLHESIKLHEIYGKFRTNYSPYYPSYTKSPAYLFLQALLFEFVPTKYVSLCPSPLLVTRIPPIILNTLIHTIADIEQLHFQSTDAFFDIYSNKNRWDKDAALYHSFGEDESSFGYVSHKEAKERRDVLSRLFSPKAVEEAENIIQTKVGCRPISCCHTGATEY
jgi:hypothetical protein